jgi:hypothetical protein
MVEWEPFRGKIKAKEERGIVDLYAVPPALSSHLQSVKMESTGSCQIDVVKSQKNVPPA